MTFTEEPPPVVLLPLFTCEPPPVTPWEPVVPCEPVVPWDPPPLTSLRALRSRIATLAFCFFIVSPDYFGLVCELFVAPNNKRAPPVTVFRGIRSSNRMDADFFPLILVAARILPLGLASW